MYILYVTLSHRIGDDTRGSLIHVLKYPSSIKAFRCSECDWMVPGTVDHN